MGKLNFNEGKVVYPRSHTSNLQDRDSKAVSVISLFIRFCGIEGKGEETGFKMERL